MEEILRKGGKPEDIIFANPSKSNSFLEYSKRNGIDLMTFDNREELDKINAIFPESRLVLRIKVDDKDSNIRLGLKFGADMQNVETILKRAKDMKMNVIGVAFHVGSGCQSSQSYVNAIKTSRVVFDLAQTMGFHMSLVDIGGGFPGTDKCYNQKKTTAFPKFREMAQVINQSLTEYYPEKNLTIIGEPGRFYCESAFTLVTKIISKTLIQTKEEKTVMYYLNDGIYGSFMDAVIDNKTYKPVPLLENNLNLNLRTVYSSILWGPTCDSLDCIRNNFKMPEMNIREWIVFEDMGSYSLPYTQYGFNGMPTPTVKIFVSETAETSLMKTHIWTKLKSYLADIKW